VRIEPGGAAADLDIGEEALVALDEGPGDERLVVAHAAT
jgi:hypothetical protein